ncbi:glycosyltransferase [Clostridium sp. SYSU_GA19001]|uniref:glycosyltransferase n=1 Tax=Clostridium caldaquaticum TaxID=2940653 RepID=UPI0020776DAB|nr:glycosyltransferase [Clostridium caldaquaticum]MCM8711262.1 glycosyltransferase [Clostridium caldaquaticum]
MIENIYASSKKSTIDVSIIIPCKNEVNTLRKTINSMIKSKNSLSYEIIVVDDNSIDGSTDFLKEDLNKEIYKNVSVIKTNDLGCAGAKNAGAYLAKGNYLFFCDAHVNVPDRWLDSLVNTLETTNAHLVAPCIVDMSNTYSAGYGQVWDSELKLKWLMDEPKGISEIPIACGCTFGITKEVFNKINGFDRFFKVWGKEDEEISLKLWLYGYKAVVNPYVKVQHLFRKSFPYKVTSFNVTYNLLCLAYSHFKKERFIKIINLAQNDFYFKDAALQIKLNEELILSQRKKYFIERKYDDDFFFNKFNIEF